MRGILLVFLVAILFLAPGCPERSSSHFLRVESLDRGMVLLNVPVKPGNLFHIDYIHSSAKTPIRSTFEVGSDGEMVLIEETFQWYGAGLEFMEHAGVGVVSEENGTSVILDRHLPSLRLRVGWLTNHRLTFNGRTIPLKEIAEGGELLKIWIVRGGGEQSN